MRLDPDNYIGKTVAEVISSLKRDERVMEFIRDNNLRGYDTLEAIAAAMFAHGLCVDVNGQGDVSIVYDL